SRFPSAPTLRIFLLLSGKDKGGVALADGDRSKKTSVFNCEWKRYVIVFSPDNRFALDTEFFCQLTLSESGLFTLFLEIDGSNLRAVHRNCHLLPVIIVTYHVTHVKHF